MTTWRLGLLLMLCGLLVGGCGGSSDPSPAPIIAVAKIASSNGVLELPLLQSGNLFYADVRIKFSPDGSFTLLSGRAVGASSAAADAQLQPQTLLADIARSDQSLQLVINRLHLDASVYEGVTLALDKGQWRYQDALVLTTTLTTNDLRANPALYANDDHLVVISSEPGRTDTFPLRLESKAYRFCMDAQDEGADEMSVLDVQGHVLLSLRAGGDCVEMLAEQGLYKVRHRYGGTGSSRTVFMRQRQAEQAPLTQPPGSRPPLLTAANPREYWGILATFLDPVSQKTSSEGFMGMAGLWPEHDNIPAGNCQANIAAFMTATAPNTRSRLAAKQLFDGANFFERIDDGTGTPVQLGPTWVCSSGRLKFETIVSRYSTALVLSAPGLLVPDDHPVRISSFAATRNTFLLTGSASNVPDRPLGFPLGVEVATPVVFTAGLQPLTPEQIDDWLPEYRVVLRYRPDGLPGATTPVQGQVALFNSKDCSGPAMLVDRYDLDGILPGGALGNFDGSVKLGTLTTATVYSSQFHRGERQVLSSSGCIASGWGSAGWKAASLSIKMDPVQIILSTNKCEQCNLAGIDLAGKSLKNVKLYGANLNNAHLANSDLSGADLRYASLQGAQLPNANLDAANLCQAHLNAAPSTAGSSNVAANLTGAFLRNANFFGGNMSGANFVNASFFSTGTQGTCQQSSCSSYQQPTCAGAYGASMEGTNFSSAYLVGVDMGSTNGSAAIFNNAVLNGASFRNATLAPDKNGTATNFSSAFLQGTDFTSANILNAGFTNAYVDLKASGGCMQFELDATYTAFPDFKVPTPPGSATCTKAAAAKTCVQFTYNKPTKLAATLDPPVTPLSQARPKNSSCDGSAPLCGDAFTGVGRNTCWAP